MDFHTTVELPQGMPPVTYEQEILLLGSCFAENIGALLAEHKFRLDINPFGILYNPSSVSAALREIIAGKQYTKEELFYYQGCWHSPRHHGIFSASEAEESLQIINSRLRRASVSFEKLDWLMVTLGTSYIYEEKRTGTVVANCHKLPESTFNRRRLTVAEIVSDYTSLLVGMFSRCPRLKVLFTVSPIRHARDGMHANQLSKSTLLLAIDSLQAAFPGKVFYFPSYEIVLDELRDYRFYAEDMLHPSSVAVNYLWECFSKTFFTDETCRTMKAVAEIERALAHKPFHPDSEAYKSFLGQIVLKIERLKGKYPYLDFEKETELCRTRLNP